MKRAKSIIRTRRKGAVLVLSLIFIVMFSALAVAMADISGVNVQVAQNQRQSDQALAAAESGLEVVRYWLGRFIMPKTTLPANYLSTIITSLQSDLSYSGVGNVVFQTDGTTQAVTLDSARNSSFSAELQMHPTNPNVLLVSVTGMNQRLSKTIQVAFYVTPYEHPIFDYGLATKGAIHFPQNPTLSGATLNWEADVYVDTADMVAIDIGGNANFDGDFTFRNPSGQISYAGDLQIGGDHGQDAIDNHVVTGVAPVDFPAPDTSAYASFVTGPTVDPATMDLTKGLTLTNARIPANLNPTFEGTVTINGILWIESPNVVTFGRNCQLNGIVIGDSYIGSTDNNQINFAGNFATGAYPTGTEFSALETMAGSSIIAPGFDTSFTGNFSAIDGVVATSGLTFAGNASADIRGTLINYSDDPTVVDGNISLTFDRSGGTKIPGGFDTHRVLSYDPSSYAMVF
ncbi:MAG: pilus assembly PilX N-terminal domain-containing protein [Sedimentisphaerales bacterium]|nr:pilus assembly PilX N-terminal domain-containing protein [Sedimentisphaerales bacterium]